MQEWVGQYQAEDGRAPAMAVLITLILQVGDGEIYTCIHTIKPWTDGREYQYILDGQDETTSIRLHNSKVN